MMNISMYRGSEIRDRDEFNNESVELGIIIFYRIALIELRFLGSRD